MTKITCTSCALPYPDNGLPHLCPRCGGVFGINHIDLAGEEAEEPGQPGIWRFRRSLPLPADANPVYLGEGGTPLVEREILGKRVAFKLENLNPTGSFKDRGTAVLTSLCFPGGKLRLWGFIRKRGASWRLIRRLWG
jgi:threonine synthase